MKLKLDHITLLLFIKVIVNLHNQIHYQLIIYHYSGDSVLKFDGSTLGAFIPFVIDSEKEEGTFLRRSNEIIVYPNQQDYAIASSSR